MTAQGSERCEGDDKGTAPIGSCLMHDLKYSVLKVTNGMKTVCGDCIENKLEYLNHYFEKVKKLENDVLLKAQKITELTKITAPAQPEGSRVERTPEEIAEDCVRKDGYKFIIKNIADVIRAERSKAKASFNAGLEVAEKIAQERVDYARPIPCPDGKPGCLVAHSVQGSRLREPYEIAKAIREAKS